MGNGFLLGDEQLRKTRALGTGATPVTSDPLDLEITSRGDFVADCEVLIEAPALSVGQLPNTETVSYSIETANNEAFNDGAEVILPAVLVQTGAGSAGAAAATERVRLPTNVKRYIRLVATGSGSENKSAATAAFSLRF